MFLSGFFFKLTMPMGIRDKLGHSTHCWSHTEVILQKCFHRRPSPYKIDKFVTKTIYYVEMKCLRTNHRNISK